MALPPKASSITSKKGRHQMNGMQPLTQSNCQTTATMKSFFKHFRGPREAIKPTKRLLRHRTMTDASAGSSRWNYRIKVNYNNLLWLSSRRQKHSSKINAYGLLNITRSWRLSIFHRQLRNQWCWSMERQLQSSICAHESANPKTRFHLMQRLDISKSCTIKRRWWHKRFKIKP